MKDLNKKWDQIGSFPRFGFWDVMIMMNDEVMKRRRKEQMNYILLQLFKRKMEKVGGGVVGGAINFQWM